MTLDEDGRLTQQQTGEGLAQTYSQRLSAQLRRRVERLGLDTPATEVLTQLVSTVMESHSPNSVQRAQMLKDGLQELVTTMSDEQAADAVFVARAQTIPTCRAAFVIRRQGKSPVYRTYMS